VKREAEEDWGVGKIMWDIHIGTHSICPRYQTPLAASEQAREGYQQAPPRSSTILGGAWAMGTKEELCPQYFRLPPSGSEPTSPLLDAIIAASTLILASSPGLGRGFSCR
jgi:hypothetical protein